MKKRVGLVVMAMLMAAFLLPGCTLFGGKSGSNENTGAFTLSMYIPQDEAAMSGSVVLTRNGMEIEVPLTISGRVAQATIEGLESGQWHLLARLRDAENYVIYQGERDAVVDNQNTTSVNVHLAMTPGNVTTHVNISGITGVCGGVIEFSNAQVIMDQQTITFTGTEGTAVFNNLQARIWDVKVNLLDVEGKIIRSARNSVQILPGRMNFLDMDFQSGTGTLSVNVTWDLPPVLPANVQAVLTEDQHIRVNWTANSETDITGYRVYKGIAETGPFYRVSGINVLGTEYTDTDVYPGNTYWYYVIAVNDKGADSGFAETPISLHIPKENIVLQYDATCGLVPAQADSRWTGYAGSVVNGELVIETNHQNIVYYMVPRDTTPKLYMKSRAKRLGGYDGSYKNIAAEVGNGTYAVILELYSDGLHVEGTNVTVNVDTSIYHEYKAVLQNDLGEVYVDGQLVWSGIAPERSEHCYMFGDWGVDGLDQWTRMAITNVEIGNIQ